MKLSIVIPAYNEEDIILETLQDCILCQPDAQIIVVNDCSTDMTLRLLKAFQKDHKQLMIISNDTNLGHAKSIIRGLYAAEGDYVLYMDADNQIKIWNLDFDYEKYDCDLIGSVRVNRQDKFFRKVISKILKLTILFRHHLYIMDANCPFKLFKRKSLLKLLNYLPKDCILPSVDMEILARKADMKILEIPVIHYPLAKPRKGFLQSLNKKSLTMFWNSFIEVITL